MKNYIFFIGGSGARVYRAFMHSAAAGVIRTSEVSVLMIDADEDNKANSTALKLYDAYRDAYAVVRKEVEKPDIYTCDIKMKTKKILSPFNTTAQTLKQAVGEGDKDENRILEWLYTKEEREQDLKGGFYAHPNIGCIFFSDFNVKEFDECLKEINRKLDNREDVNVALVGSIFGGTGAAGIPTIMKIINRELGKNKNFSNLHVGGIFLEPYFRVLGENEDERNISIDMNSFYFNTYDALQYYNEMDEFKFKSIYLVGQSQLDIVSAEYASRGAKQDNKAHIVELYAALALDRFFCYPEEEGVFGYIREEKMNWGSFPEIKTEEEKIFKLADFARAQAIYTSEICSYEYINQGMMEERFKRLGIMVPPWYKEYHIKDNFPPKSENVIAKYGLYFTEWVCKMNCIIDEDGTARWNKDMNLFGKVLEDVDRINKKVIGEEETDKADIQNLLKNIRDNFNQIVDTASNIEYVKDKIGDILSMVTSLAKGTSAGGAVALFMNLLSLVSKRK